MIVVSSVIETIKVKTIGSRHISANNKINIDISMFDSEYFL